MKIKNKINGFTLIELMIVVLIVGILGSIAYPSYIDYVRNSKLPEGTGNLSTMKNKMEHYFQDERTYTGACDSAAIKSLLKDTSNFTYECEADGETFTLSAIGSSEQTKGFNYSINEIGEKQTVASPAGYSTGACWVMTKSGCI